MKFTIVTISTFVALVAITGCNGQFGENEKMFGFLRSAEKCTKESDPEGCVKRNLDDWCEKRGETLEEGTKIASVCNCLEGSPSVSEVRDCIQGKVETYCSNNPDDFKCEMFDRCKDDGDTINAKKDCVKAMCQEPANEDRFECLAFSCRENYALPPAKLDCIKEACEESSSDDSNNLICQKIQNCEDENEGAGRLGMLRIFRCLIRNVFDGLE